MSIPYHLGSILLMDFFPYYLHWPFNERRWSKEYITLTRKGHNLWEGNWIYKSNNTYMVLAKVLVIIFVWMIITHVLPIKRLQHKEGKTVELRQKFPDTLSPPSCHCSYFTQTGKYCEHLHAASWYESNSFIDQYLQEQKVWMFSMS